VSFLLPLDPRSVANAIVTFANEYDQKITHLGLQKIIYFAHGKHLVERGEPLVSGYFEAWPYGPVHPLIYSTFQAFGSDGITTMAKRKNLLSGKIDEISQPDDMKLRLFIRESVTPYLRLSPGRLVDLSHAPGTPWDVLTKTDDGKRAFGMRITDRHIKELFRYHKISVGDSPRIGEPNEESPPS
jgi:uncharacterized phage-associated protein